MEDIRDLLGTDPHTRMELKEDEKGTVFVKNLTSTVVKTATEI